MGQNFITGLVLRPGEVEWTVLRASRKGVEVHEYRRVDLPSPDAEDPYGTPEALAVLKQAGTRLRGEVNVSVASDKALLRVVDLPSPDPAEWEGMAELQVDKFSPFPVEHMAIAVEPLARAEASTRALIATIQREIVERAGAALGRAGVHAHRVDVEVMGWWHLLKADGAIPAAGRSAVLLLDRRSADLIIAQDGVPALLRSLGAPRDNDPSFHDEVAEEVGYTLTTVESELGAGGPPPMALWHHEGAQVGGLAAQLRAAGAAAPVLHSLERLSPLSEGLARRALDPEARRLNLAPPAWASDEQSRLIRRRLLAATAGFLVLWLAAIGGGLLGLKLQRARLAELQRQVDRIEGPAADVRAIKQKVEAFEQYADRTYSAIECLREASRLLPAGIDLTSFYYKKAGTLSLRGESAETELIYDFIQALEGSELFTAVKAEGVRLKTAGGRQVSEFNVTATLPGGAAEEGETP